MLENFYNKRYIVRFLSSIALIFCTTLAFSQQKIRVDAGNISSAENTDKLILSIQAADNALASGFSSIAVSLYQSALANPLLKLTQRNKILLNLASALISQMHFVEAEQVLHFFPEKNAPAFILRQALIAYQQGNFKQVKQDLDAISEEPLDPEEKAWFNLLLGLLYAEKGELKKRDAFFQRAKELTISETQLTQFNLIFYWNYLLLGSNFQKETLKSLEKKLKTNPVSFYYTQIYAAALHQSGHSQEAIKVIEEQLRYIHEKGSLEEQLLILLAMISGVDSNKGRLALENVLRQGKDPELQKIALYLLAGTTLNVEQNNGIKNLLDELIQNATASNKNKPHPLLDEFYYFQAIIYLRSNLLNQAEITAKKLIDQYPNSPLKKNALYMLAYIAWKRPHPQYRTIAGYLNQLRIDLKTSPEKALLAMLVADSYYLNGDYKNANDAYALAMRELSQQAYTQELGRLLYQRVTSEIQLGQLEQAQAHLDEYANKINDPFNRWRAEWNLLNKMRESNQKDQAIERIQKLLQESKKEQVPPLLLLRIILLEAELAVQRQQYEEIPKKTDNILKTLEQVPEKEVSQEQRELIISRAQLLKIKAYFVRKQEKEALEILQKLRKDYPDTNSTIVSHLIEARYYAENNRMVDAQKSFRSLADQYPNSKYASIALYEAAICAQQRGIDATEEGPAEILENIVKKYPTHKITYYAQLKRADISRRLNKFGDALMLYEDLLKQYPDHPERYLAQISRADCLFAQSGQTPVLLDEAIAVYERLVDNQEVPIDLRIESGFKWAFAKARGKDLPRAKEIYFLIINRFLLEPEKSQNTLGTTGRYWMSRILFELGSLLEKESNYEEAHNAYKKILTHNLPGQSLAKIKIQTQSHSK
jgi:cellulose synthase operon protein C